MKKIILAALIAGLLAAWGGSTYHCAGYAVVDGVRHSRQVGNLTEEQADNFVSEAIMKDGDADCVAAK